MTIETFFKHYDKGGKRYLDNTDMSIFFHEMGIEIPKKMQDAFYNKIGFEIDTTIKT